MFSDLFDSPWKILIVAVVLIVLFGSKKLPHAARSLGQSMRILKKKCRACTKTNPPLTPQVRQLPLALRTLSRRRGDRRPSAA